MNVLLFAALLEQDSFFADLLAEEQLALLLLPCHTPLPSPIQDSLHSSP